MWNKQYERGIYNIKKMLTNNDFQFSQHYDKYRYFTTH